MKKIDYKGLFTNDLSLKIISILLSVIAWIIVVYTVDPMKNHTIVNIPVQISLAGTSAESSGLSVIGDTTSYTVNYTVYGKSYEINKLDASDFKATCEITDITIPGTYTLNVSVKKISDKPVQYQEVSTSPKTMTLTFDRLTSKVFPIEALVTNKEPEKGYIIDQYATIPKELSVKGPESVISRISKVIIENNEKMTINTSSIINGNLKFLDENGQNIDTTNLVYKDTDFKISIPLYKKMTLPLTLEFINVPNGIDKSQIKYSIHPVDKIDIAVPVDAAASTTEISLGSVDFRTLSLGKTQTFDISLLAGYINIDGVHQVNVTFHNSEEDGYKQSYLSIPSSNIVVKNVPPEYDVSIISNVISNVQIIGKSDVIDNLNSSSIVATADLSTLTTINEGEQRIPVNITLQDKQQAWALGQKYILISVKKK